jgi:transketolase
MSAAEALEPGKIATRVVSMPCREWFERAVKSYQEKVLAHGGPGAGQRRGRCADGLA